MRYQVRPEHTVEAYEITRVSYDERDMPPTIDYIEDNGDFTVLMLDEGQVSRFHPRVGDFLVVTGDGYKYLNPRDVFIKKYRICEISEEAE